MDIRKVAHSSNCATQFAGCHIPQGCVYIVTRNPRMYIWIENVSALVNAKTLWVDVQVLDASSNAPHKRVISTTQGIVAYMRDYAIEHKSEIPAFKRPILRRDLRGLEPRDRLPQKFDAPHGLPARKGTIEDRSVVDGAKLGRRFGSERDYNSVRLGLPCWTL